MSSDEKIVPTEHDLKGIKVSDPRTAELIRSAKQSDAADRKLSVRAALGKYRKAVFWGMFLSLALVMEGFDGNMMSSFYGQTQFKSRFGTVNPATGEKLIPAPWQSGLSNASAVGQLFGLVINAYTQDRFGARNTMMVFMLWMAIAIFIPVFTPSLAVLALGEAMCGIPWGVFQTLSTTYACELVPTVLRPYVTAWVCMCWGIGLTFSAGVLRAVLVLDGDLGWRLPIMLQWIWPLPLFIGAYCAPESPWNAVRRGKMDLARKSLTRLRTNPDPEEIEATLAYIQYTTDLEKSETKDAAFLDCFRGTNLRRTEINCVVWCAQILCGNAIQGYAVVFLESAGFSEEQAFDLNVSLNACFIAGGIICWFLMPRFGRATIYMTGMTYMFFSLIVIGGLGFTSGKGPRLAIGVIMTICQLVNLISIGPVAYPIVAETPSGKLRYKTITIGRFAYVCTGILNNVITPRMLSATAWNWGAKAALFYAGTNLLCNIWCWFRLPETKDRTFGELDLLFDHKVPARKFRTTKVDQFAAEGVAADTDEKMSVTVAHKEFEA
ncbi:Maltose permease MAL61 [Exophiala dermatitidis]